MIKEVHLHEDAIKHQEHHSTDSFRNPATLGTALNTYISVDPFWSLKEGKFQCGMRIMVKAPTLNQKSSWAIEENGFVPIKKRQKFKYSCCMER